LAGLILKAAENTQVWVVTHSQALVSALGRSSDMVEIELEKVLGQTQVKGQTLLERPLWKWRE
jgi:predicted ATPase